MAWTAEVTGKSFANDTLKITVQYTDGKTTFTEEYVSRGIIPTDWVQNVAAAKIKSLEYLEKYSVDLGAVTKPIIDQDYLDFMANLVKYKKAYEMVSVGVLDAADADFVALKKDITDNVKRYWDKL